MSQVLLPDLLATCRQALAAAESLVERAKSSGGAGA